MDSQSPLDPPQPFLPFEDEGEPHHQQRQPANVAGEKIYKSGESQQIRSGNTDLGENAKEKEAEIFGNFESSEFKNQGRVFPNFFALAQLPHFVRKFTFNNGKEHSARFN
mmetsp:Transcript_8303/g.13881  ORF Transcript_8303/g.13881 Transcript_8303/m.13881 type:complete len:110 (-) Transcript_8303:2330-2659(-)